MKVLIVAAHPDDETLGCGGVAARLAANGHSVHAAILGEGGTSRDDNIPSPSAAVSHLQGAARTAAEILGITSVSFHSYPDNRFDTVPLLQIVKTVEQIAKDIAPTLVFTHFHGDLNIDHVLTSRAVLTALRPGVIPSVEKIFAFEVPSSTQWTFNTRERPFSPNVFVNIHPFLDRKIQAMEAYTSEARDYPHPRSAAALRAAASYWGSTAGLPAAEPFELVRWIHDTGTETF